jgi:serine/threonine protein kinase
MGVVYRARDTRLGREVAIRVLPPDRLADETRRRRFAQEARAASSLNHPNIVTIHEIESSEGRDFIVMELVPGRSLETLIGRQGLRQDRVVAGRRGAGRCPRSQVRRGRCGRHLPRIDEGRKGEAPDHAQGAEL